MEPLFRFFHITGESKLVELSPKAIKDGLNSRCATILAAYRKHCSSPQSIGLLILPECMKLLPLYTNSLLKSDALTGGIYIIYITLNIHIQFYFFIFIIIDNL